MHADLAAAGEIVGTAHGLRCSWGPLKRIRQFRALLAVLLLAVGFALTLRQNIPVAFLGLLPPIDLAQPEPWLVDLRLTALRHNSALCQRVTSSPLIEAHMISDLTMQNGCGWTNSVRMKRAGSVRASFDKITCESAAALALWLNNDVQQIAQDTFGQHVVSLQTFGGYSCRNVIGDPLGVGRRSEHATANAVDIRGFTLSNGRSISVRSHWQGDSNEAQFLRAVRSRACRYFHVVLDPDDNAAHRDHMHLDRGPFRHCR
jgi:hypothetical protein